MAEYSDFEHFGLDPLLIAAIKEMGYSVPTPIQAKAIPIVLRGGDVMGAAQTGTGKTAGFGLPILQRLLPTANTSMSPARHPVRALVLTPTRELADQVADNLKRYASKTALRVTVVYGGVDMQPQTDALRRGAEVVIATPGRLLDHVQQKNISLSQAGIVVLDEADRMLDMGFLPDISRILNLLPRERQSLMFSATFSEEIKKLAANFLRSPQLVEVARRNATAETVQQLVVKLHESDKVDVLYRLLSGQVPGVAAADEARQVLVFVNAKIECRRLARQLQKMGLNADAIHGDKTQDERTAALAKFKTGEIEVLVATDVAARGLDIAELPVVINFDVPFNAEDYIHRIGRTGRAGASGVAVTLATGADERQVAAIEKLIKKTIVPIEVEGDRQALAPVRSRQGRERSDDRRPEGRRMSGRSSPAAPVDEFFLKPYEPPAEPVDTAQQTAAEERPEPGNQPGSSKLPALLARRRG